jgi:uncharacterized protein (TIGR02001 family)
MKMILAAAAAAMLASGAQAAELGGLTLSGDVTIVSDYRFRGYSLSNEEPALQGGVTLSAPSGFYAGVWASTIDEYGTDADGDGAKIEIDTTVGYAGEAYGWGFDVAAVRYNYPDASDVSYWELPVSISRVIGPLTFTAGGAYVPEQDNTGDQDNVYVYGQTAVELPTTHPVTVSASLGHEDGAFADSKLDWSVGASTAFGPLNVGLTYVDADAPGVSGAVVASIGVAF